MSGPQQAVPQTLPVYDRVTPQSVFEGNPERISVLLTSCQELTRYLLDTEDLRKINRTWEPIWREFWDWSQRIHREGHPVDRRTDLPLNIRLELIKRLQIFEAELKVACAFIELSGQSPTVIPRILIKDLVNIQAMFWPAAPITTARTEQPTKVIDYDQYRVVIKDGQIQ